MASNKKLNHDKMYTPRAVPEKLLLQLRPLDYITVDYKTDLLQEVKKKDADQPVMKLAVAETTHILNPEQNGLHITDSSLTDKNRTPGAGIRCKLLSFYLTLGQHATHCGRGLEANECCTNASF
jgi:hypothetical protein